MIGDEEDMSNNKIASNRSSILPKPGALGGGDQAPKSKKSQNQNKKPSANQFRMSSDLVTAGVHN